MRTSETLQLDVWIADLSRQSSFWALTCLQLLGMQSFLVLQIVLASDTLRTTSSLSHFTADPVSTKFMSVVPSFTIGEKDN